MILKSIIAAGVASGLAMPERPALIVPKPAIIKPAKGWDAHEKAMWPLGIVAAKSSGPWAVSYGNSINNTTAALTHTYTAVSSVAYKDRAFFVLVSSASALHPTGVTVGGVAAAIDSGASMGVGGTFMSIWKVTGVSGPAPSIVITYGAATACASTCYIVSGAKLGASVLPEYKQSYTNNSNTSGDCVFTGGAVGDIFVAVGSKIGGGTNTFGGWSSAVAEAIPALDVRVQNSGSHGFGSSAQQTAATARTINATGTDSSKPTATIIARISKGP